MSNFDTREREIRRQARIRGSGKRVIQAHKLKIVDEQQSIESEDNTYILEGKDTLRNNPDISSEYAVLKSLPASQQKRGRGRPKKKRAGGRKPSSHVIKPISELVEKQDKTFETKPGSIANSVPNLPLESFSRRPAIPLTIKPDPVHDYRIVDHPQGFGTENQLLKQEEVRLLDVLRRLVEEFKSDVPYSAQFKKHVFMAIDQVRDTSVSLESTAKSISKLEKEKEQLRDKILVVKGQSRNVALVLSELREKERNKNLEYELMRSIHERMGTLKQEANGASPLGSDTSGTVEAQLTALKPLFKHEEGIVSKLSYVNEKLKDKEGEFPT